MQPAQAQPMLCRLRQYAIENRGAGSACELAKATVFAEVSDGGRGERRGGRRRRRSACLQGAGVALAKTFAAWWM